MVNDFVASGYGILTLNDTELTTLQKGKRNSKCPIAVLGAGTGLGECFLTPSYMFNSEFYDAYPTEGGHVEFAPKTSVQVIARSQSTAFQYPAFGAGGKRWRWI